MFLLSYVNQDPVCPCAIVSNYVRRKQNNLKKHSLNELHFIGWTATMREQLLVHSLPCVYVLLSGRCSGWVVSSSPLSWGNRRLLWIQPSTRRPDSGCGSALLCTTRRSDSSGRRHYTTSLLFGSVHSCLREHILYIHLYILLENFRKSNFIRNWLTDTCIYVTIPV